MKNFVTGIITLSLPLISAAFASGQEDCAKYFNPDNENEEVSIRKMKASIGKITAEPWNCKLNLDPEAVRPWHYLSRLVHDGITVSFAPGKKCVI